MLFFAQTANFSRERISKSVDRRLHQDPHLKRYELEERRNEHLLGSYVKINALSAILGSAPYSLEFVDNDFGKSRLTGPFAASKIEFSLSHTRGMVVLMVTHEYPVGVDVEWLGYSPKSLLQIARLLLSDSEADDLQACEGQERTNRFLSYWTQKEALAKKDGTGLTRSLKVSNAISQAQNDRANSACPHHFGQLTVSPMHLVSWSIGSNRQPRPTVILCEVLP